MRYFGAVAMLLAAAVLLAAACAAQAGQPAVVAHRGASTDAPENTLAAFNLAWKQGADGIEGDYYLTTDKRIVCMHDGNAKRTAGVNVKITEASYADLAKLDVGTWKDAKFAGERIPTLEQVLATIPAGKFALLEMKAKDAAIVPYLKDVLAKSGLQADQAHIISFHEGVLAEVHRQIPQVKVCWLTQIKKDKKGQWKPTADGIIATLKEIGATGVDCKANAEAISPELVKQVQQAGYEFGCWDVNDAKLARQMRDAGVTSLTTNKPVEIRKAIKDRR